MKRPTIIKTFIQSLNPGDIAVFVGESLSKEAEVYKRDGNLYLSEYANSLSVGLGIAVCSDRRVFVFCSDAYFLRNFSETIQVAVSKCKNMFIILLVDGVYSDVGKFPTLYGSINSLSGILFNAGLMTHNYNRLFRNTKNPGKEVKAIFSTARGPLVVIVETDYSSPKNIEWNPKTETESIENIRGFILDKDIPSFNFIPPISLDKFLFPTGEV